MISDQERREVAERLRRSHRRDGESQLKFIAHMVYGKERTTAADYINLPFRLANLIDRPTAKQEHNGAYWRCTHCGAFTRKDAVVMDGLDVVPLRCCGNCGREWE